MGVKDATHKSDDVYESTPENPFGKKLLLQEHGTHRTVLSPDGMIPVRRNRTSSIGVFGVAEAQRVTIELHLPLLRYPQKVLCSAASLHSSNSGDCCPSAPGKSPHAFSESRAGEFFRGG